MKIVEYDDLDPLQVLHLAMLALGFSLTPERAYYPACFFVYVTR